MPGITSNDGRERSKLLAREELYRATRLLRTALGEQRDIYLRTQVYRQHLAEVAESLAIMDELRWDLDAAQSFAGQSTDRPTLEELRTLKYYFEHKQLPATTV